MKKILYRRAFPQEFRVRSHTKLYAAFPAVDAQYAPQLLPGLRGYRTFLHYQLWFACFGGDLTRHVVNRRKVGFTVLERWRSDANENSISGAHSFSGIAREGELL